MVDLPAEVIGQVLEYAGKVKLRNGKYINQISKEDPRYDILRTIPLKHGGTFMIYNKWCYMVQVVKDGKNILLYKENHPCHPEGEISITHIYICRSYHHIIGNKFPPCFVPADDYKTTKKWIEDLPDL
jgi:hypothetical protein